MMAHDPPRYEIGQHGALEVMAFAMQQPSDAMYQRIEIAIDLSPEDTHRRSPFSWKNRNACSLAANAAHFATFRFAWSSRPSTRRASFTPRPASPRCSMRVAAGTGPP